MNPAPTSGAGDWRLAWRLARRELDLRFRGLRLLLACLILGVGALAAIGSLTDAIGRELGSRGAVLLGGDVEFAVSQRPIRADERAMLTRAGTLSETVRMQSSVVAGPAAAPRVVPVELKGVDGAYPLYGALTLADGRHVGAPDADGVWLMPTAIDRLGVRPGQPVTIGNARFIVRGVIADEPDRLGEGFTLGPVAIVSMQGIARSGLLQPGSLYKGKYRVRLPARTDPQAVADRFRAAFPTEGWVARTRDRAAPTAARLVDRMGEFLALVGLSALVIAGIGVGNGVASYLAARRRSIATLKVLGATSALVTRIYLLQIGVVAGIGIAAGLVLGAAAVPLLLWAASKALPVAAEWTIEPLPLLRAAAHGALVALAFALPPLIAAGRTPPAGLLRGTVGRARAGWWRTVLAVAVPLALSAALAIGSSARAELAAGFLAAVAGALALLAGFGWLVRRGAALLPRPRRPLVRLAIAGLHRPGAQTVALVVALGLGLTLFVMLAATRSAIDANIAHTVPARAPALFALDVPRDREAAFRATVRRVAPAARITTVPVMRATITGYRDICVADLKAIPDDAWALRGERTITYSDTLPDGSEIVSGRWWPAGYTGPPLVSVDEQLARSLGLKVGDPLTVSLFGVERTARIASIRRISWDTLGFNFVLVFSPDAVADAPHNLAATIDMPPGREGAVIRALLAPFPSVSVVEVRGVLAEVQGLVGQMAAAIAAAAGVAVLAGIAVLVGAIAAAREARSYDGVILRTLGATRGQVLASQAIEYALLALAVSALALALGLAGAWYVVAHVFSFAWLPDPVAIALTLAVGAVVTMGLGLAGGWRLLGVRPAAALRQV